MPFNQINFKDKDTALFQDNVNNALIPLQNAPLSGGQLLSNLSLTAAQDNLISHSLGYSPTILLAMIPNVNTTIWSPVTASLNGSNVSSSQINLRCSTTCVVSVMVK